MTLFASNDFAPTVSCSCFDHCAMLLCSLESDTALGQCAKPWTVRSFLYDGANGRRSLPIDHYYTIPPYQLSMSVFRPAPLEAAFRSCARAQRSPVARDAFFHRNRRLPTPQRRYIADGGPRPPIPPGSPATTKVVAPRTRLAIGVVFIGALIYSMVRSTRPLSIANTNLWHYRPPASPRN